MNKVINIFALVLLASLGCNARAAQISGTNSGECIDIRTASSRTARPCINFTATAPRTSNGP